MSLKVKSNGSVGLLMYDFLLVSDNNYMSICNRLATRTIFSYLLTLEPNFGSPHPPLPFISKSNGFIPGSDGSPPPKMKLIGSNLFQIVC